MKHNFLIAALAAAIGFHPLAAEPLKVHLMAGQSNKVGFGQVRGGTGTMEAYVRSDPMDYGRLVDAKGEPVVRNGVWVVDISYLVGDSMGKSMVGLLPGNPITPAGK